METQIVIAGFGGEGIIFMTTILAEGAFRHGYPVISTETHGMAMRGGSVISQLKIGNFQSPMIRYGEADLLIATSEKEVERNLLYLKKKGGKIIVDSPKGEPYSINAKGIAHQLGNLLTANIVLLGYVITKLDGFYPRIFEETIASLSPRASLELNLEAFRRGYEEGRKKVEIAG
jgi:indolepyruvate ferredoxin oxidoreductase, beta subunit